MQKLTLISLINSQIKPRGIRLEAATVCQLKCPSCETAQGITHEKLGSGFLKLKDFEKLVDENTWVSTIELSNWGEIFLNPDLSDIIQYAYENNVALRASNGVNLNTVKEKILEDLVQGG
jgi:MoaA/NifB/PqqE/SkfB family radical SAM enzyme